VTDTIPAPPYDAASLQQPSRGPLGGLQHALHRYPTISPALVLVASCIVFAFASDGKFQQPFNLGIMLQQTAVLAVLAVGQTLIIITAGVDLAVGTAMLLTHMVVAKTAADNGVPGIAALALGAVVGLALGAFHGSVVTQIGLPPFIVTLGTFYIYNSLGLRYGQAETISKEAIGTDSLLMWTAERVTWGEFNITAGVLVAIIVYIVFGFVLAKTAWGRHVYATGDDREAARLAGIDVTRVLISVYMVAGFIYAIGAWVQNAATDINLQTITAVVIGGTSLFGGRGRLTGTLIGALIVTTFTQGLKLSGVQAYWQNFAIGSLILVAVALDQWIRRVGK
jgi:fructose transport system permease protein